MLVSQILLIEANNSIPRQEPAMPLPVVP